MATTTYEPLPIRARLPGHSRNGGGRNGSAAPGPLRGTEDRPIEPAQTGIWVTLGAITMSFAALTSALVVRQGAALDWGHLALPPVLYLNTVVLIASSFTLEIARRQIRSYARGVENRISIAVRWLAATLVLGLLFVAGQYTAWLQLRAEGVYLANNPNSSFFYLFTGLHAAHVLGGLLGLGYVLGKFRRSILKRSTFSAAAQYWHFMGLLWLYLLLLLGTKL